MPNNTALTNDRRQALGEALSEYFGKLDSDEGIRSPDGRILRAFDYCDSRTIDDLIDRAIVPVLAASTVEQPDAAPVKEMIRFCPECGRLGDIPAGYEACCPDWSHARIVPKRFAELCAETFRLCVSQPYPKSTAEPEDERADTPIGYICADDLKELASGNGAIVSPKGRETDVPVFARTASANATGAEGAKPTAWVRFRSDGGFEGPIMDTDARICDTRRTSGAWTPLYDRPAQAAEPVAIPAGYALVPIERSYDMRTKALIAFNTAEHTGKDRDDALDTAHRATIAAAPPPPAPASAPVGLTDAARDVLAERRRQVEQEGWTPEHDNEHDSGEMPSAAACYSLSAGHWSGALFEKFWPAHWSRNWWKPTTPRRDLVKAGALILAEIERLDRSAARPQGSQS